LRDGGLRHHRGMQNLPRVVLDVAGHEAEVHVARSAEHRALGLMHRAELGPDEGMLFVEDEPAPQRYWMKDTPLALSIAFIDDDGTVLQTGDLEPHSLEPECSEHAVRYVLEMPQGWFSERGIGVGARVTGPVFAAVLVGNAANER
jgi:uncharacterized membrane protein (UPF0127 family)